jgi:hypothetical protein
MPVPNEIIRMLSIESSFRINRKYIEQTTWCKTAQSYENELSLNCYNSKVCYSVSRTSQATSAKQTVSRHFRHADNSFSKQHGVNQFCRLCVRLVDRLSVTSVET